MPKDKETLAKEEALRKELEVARNERIEREKAEAEAKKPKPSTASMQLKTGSNPVIPKKTFIDKEAIKKNILSQTTPKPVQNLTATPSATKIGSNIDESIKATMIRANQKNQEQKAVKEEYKQAFTPSTNYFLTEKQPSVYAPKSEYHPTTYQSDIKAGGDDARLQAFNSNPHISEKYYKPLQSNQNRISELTGELEKLQSYLGTMSERKLNEKEVSEYNNLVKAHNEKYNELNNLITSTEQLADKYDRLYLEFTKEKTKRN